MTPLVPALLAAGLLLVTSCGHDVNTTVTSSSPVGLRAIHQERLRQEGVALASSTRQRSTPGVRKASHSNKKRGGVLEAGATTNATQSIRHGKQRRRGKGRGKGRGKSKHRHGKSRAQHTHIRRNLEKQALVRNRTLELLGGGARILWAGSAGNRSSESDSTRGPLNTTRSSNTTKHSLAELLNATRNSYLRPLNVTRNSLTSNVTKNSMVVPNAINNSTGLLNVTGSYVTNLAGSPNITKNPLAVSLNVKNLFTGPLNPTNSSLIRRSNLRKNFMVEPNVTKNLMVPSNITDSFIGSSNAPRNSSSGGVEANEMTLKFHRTLLSASVTSGSGLLTNFSKSVDNVTLGGSSSGSEGGFLVPTVADYQYDYETIEWFRAEEGAVSPAGGGNMDPGPMQAALTTTLARVLSVLTDEEGRGHDQEDDEDPCERWMHCKDKLQRAFLGPLGSLPSCPCRYPSAIFYDDKIWDKEQGKYFRWRDVSGEAERLDVYKPGAAYCIRSLLAQGSTSLAAQHCCYDRYRRLITRGSGAGTPDLVSPEVSVTLHEKVDVVPWRLCKGDFTRYNKVRPPNNQNNCTANPDDREFQRQVQLAQYF
ncbi:uncharacterized protein [Periplaneta americana]|uniref:uncharacterized protein n=1 Tax=Periplaneta americana TaxID=6978 RepID=UPI0037E7251C